MRHAYWCVEAILGVALVVAPIVERFTSLRPAAQTEVFLGAAIIVWALVGYDRMNHDLSGANQFTRT